MENIQEKLLERILRELQDIKIILQENTEDINVNGVIESLELKEELRSKAN